MDTYSMIFFVYNLLDSTEINNTIPTSYKLGTA